MNDFYRHKKSDKIKWIITAVCFVLLFAFMAGLCMQLFAKDDKYKPSEWFKKPDAEQMQPDTDENKSPETAALSFAVTHTAAKTTASTDVVALSDNTYSSLGVPLSEEEVSKLKSLFAFRSVLSNVSSSTVVSNNIDNTTMTGVLGLRGGIGGALPQAMDFIVIPKTNVFTNLPHHSFESVIVKNSGTSVSPFTMYPISDNFYVYTFGSFNASDITVEYNLFEVEKPIPLPADPVKEGHTFMGWYLDEERTQRYDGRPIYSDTKLYAKFEINRYTVTFNSDGGSSVASQTVNWNTVLTPTTPTRDGYTFKGWFMSDGTQYTNQAITADTTLTARWEIIMCTVTFYVDGEVYDTKTVEYGTSLVYVIESANELNLCVTSVRSVNGSIGGADLTNMIVTDDSIEVEAEELTGTDKVINTIKNNKWAVVGGVAGGIALIAVIAAIADGVKRKKR